MKLYKISCATTCKVILKAWVFQTSSPWTSMTRQVVAQSCNPSTGGRGKRTAGRSRDAWPTEQQKFPNKAFPKESKQKTHQGWWLRCRKLKYFLNMFSSVTCLKPQRGKQQALPRLLLCSLQMVPVASASSLASSGIHSHQISPVISISAHYCLTLALSLPLTQLLPLLSFKSPGSPGFPLGLPSHFPLWCFFCLSITC